MLKIFLEFSPPISDICLNIHFCHQLNLQFSELNITPSVGLKEQTIRPPPDSTLLLLLLLTFQSLCSSLYVTILATNMLVDLHLATLF